MTTVYYEDPSTTETDATTVTFNAVVNVLIGWVLLCISTVFASLNPRPAPPRQTQYSKCPNWNAATACWQHSLWYGSACRLQGEHPP